MRIVYLFLLLLIGLTTSCDSPEPVGKKRAINQKQIEKRNADKAYDYNREIQKQGTPYIQTLMKWLSSIGEFLGTTVGIILIIAFFALVIIYFVRASGLKKSSKESFKSTSKVIIEDDLEELKKLPLAKIEDKIAFALKNKDYRTAIRYSFVASLLTLNDKKKIKYNLEKTNHEYQREVPKELKHEFNILCFIYDHVWYGSYETTPTIWNQFSSIKTKLLSHE